MLYKLLAWCPSSQHPHTPAPNASALLTSLETIRSGAVIFPLIEPRLLLIIIIITIISKYLLLTLSHYYCNFPIGKNYHTVIVLLLPG